MAPLQPKLVLGTITAPRVVLRSSKVLVVGTVLAPFSVSATIMGHVGATRVAPVFPFCPDLVMRTFLVFGSCLAPVGPSC